MKPEAPLNLEELTNRFWQLQRLSEGRKGQYLAPELKSTWDEMVDIIHGEDEVKIKDLRERIQDIIKEETKLHEQEGWCGPTTLQSVAKQEHIGITQSELAKMIDGR